MNVFPELTIQSESLETQVLPIYKEWAYDFEKNEFLTRGGKYYLVDKDEALKIWIYKALRTARYRYQAYSRKYGSELDEVIGLSADREICESEIQRYIEECLLVNPYIQSVEDFEFTYADRVKVDFTVSTVYGVMETDTEVDI